MSLTTRSTRSLPRPTQPRTPFNLPSARRSFQIVLVLALPALSACADRATDATSPPSLSLSSARADRSFPTKLASVGWQEEVRTQVTNHPVTMSPIVAVRVYALLGVAQYGAVVDVDKQLDADGILSSDGFGDGGRARFEAERGAVAGASAQVLSYIFSDVAVALEQRLSDEGKAGPGGVHPQFTRGVAVGRTFGNWMIEWAKHDGFATAWTGTLSVGDGFWTRNLPIPPSTVLPAIAGPQFGAIRPYFLTSGGQFHPPTPPAFGSEAFLTDLREVSTISAHRTDAQLTSARFWNLANGTPTALGYWDALASQYIGENHYDERAAAHVFALTSAAAMDAVIGCWEAKFTYDYIRPYQVNQTTYPITTPIGTPNHPSYPSGHSCVSAAAAEVIEAFFPEHSAAVDAQVIEAGNSRIYGGLHYRFDITAGQNLGRSVAGAALAFDRERGLLAAVR